MHKRIIIGIIILLISNFIYGNKLSNEERIESLFEYAELNSEFNIKNSLDSVNFALSLSRKNNLISLEVESLRRLSRLMLTKFSNYEEAYKFVEEIKTIADSNKDEVEFLAIYHNSLGSIYFYENTIRTKALTEFNKSLEIYKKNNIKPDLLLLNNYALALMENGEFNEALKLFHFARKSILEKNRDSQFYYLLIKNSINLGVLNYPDSSEYYFKDAIFLSENTLEKSDDMISNIYLAVFYQEQNFNEEALIYFQKALKFDTKYVPVSMIITLYKGLSELYANMNEYKMAYKYELVSQNYQDSLTKMGLDLQVVSMEYKANVEAMKYQQNLNRLELLQADERLTKQIILFVSLIVFILLITFFWFYKLNKSKQITKIKAERDLLEKEATITTKNKELLGANLELAAQADAMQKLKHSIEGRLSKEYDSEFNELSVLLKQTNRILNETDRRKYISKLIKSSSNEFNQKLILSFPKLTEDELKLSALILLNLSAEELLDIFNISKASLNTKRYRMRKKLSLRPEDSLEEFIRSF